MQLLRYVYWAKVLTDHLNNCGNFFVIQHFGMEFGTLIWHQSCASAWIWHSACILRMRIHIKPLKRPWTSRNDFNWNSNHTNSNNNVFSLKWQAIDSQVVKHVAEKDPQKWRMSMLQTQIVSQRKIIDCYSFTTTPIDRKWIFYAYRWSSIVCTLFRPPGILPYQFSCCWNRMAYVVHHTMNRNGNYTGGKRNTLPFEEKNCHW